jgi:hypothetical protein
MPQSLSKILVHLIFCTKHREPVIAPDIRPCLHAYMVGILNNLKSPSLQTGGVRADELQHLRRRRVKTIDAIDGRQHSGKCPNSSPSPLLEERAGERRPFIV